MTKVLRTLAVGALLAALPLLLQAAEPIYPDVSRAAADIDAALKEAKHSYKRVLIDFGTLRAAKAIMAMLGVDCGPVRTPLRAMSPSESQELYERLRPLDIFVRPLRKP